MDTMLIKQNLTSQELQMLDSEFNKRKKSTGIMVFPRRTRGTPILSRKHWHGNWNDPYPRWTWFMDSR